ncbi:hypothetical protein N7517_004735 [Penicillium concentricum]|uniref:Uncharacterized protein n=1 Tax=Penicillium concentricum TaxID=293559 RepID=A0A9W9V9N4_9EURO|nr:uncharacterized protein N7517_004735 [Penicillium concentricum]KAJ5372729.1 hypothetical protein N7517_004735 [Penicillium concentricum]
MATLTNAGDGPLQVPGFGSIPLTFELPPEARFAHGLGEYRHSPRLTKREMAMLRLMQHITEQLGWDRTVLDSDETKLAQWYQDAVEGTEGYLISTAAWNWCLAELRDKAEAWQVTGRLLVFDSSSAVCQADLPMKLSLEEIQKEVAQLGPQQAHGYPLVDPSLYPLVYDRSHVLVHGGHGSLDNLWGIAREVTKELPVYPVDQAERWPGADAYWMPGKMGTENCWSNRFQWLPCEVQFSSMSSQTPNDGPDVRITSYVNNLHPDHHTRLYKHLEHVIAASVPSWNEILFYGNTRGRHPPRILTYGCQIHNYMEEHKLFKDLLWASTWADLFDTYEEWQELCAAAREYSIGPEPPKWKQADFGWPTKLLEDMTPEQWDNPEHVRCLLESKRRRKAWFDHPEPGVSFSYEQWKQGQFTGRAIRPQRYGKFPDPLNHDHTAVRLEHTFKEDGLQVVVEINRIELTPEDPEYPGDTHFHTEGLRNDHIVATSLYAAEANNVTQARVAFEHEDKVHASELNCEEVPAALSTVLDVDSWETHEQPPPRALHTFGSVPITEGRLLSWPNTYRSKQESFRLRDPSQPGNMTLIKLRLVDPHYRVCSTRNVPPQQHDWWAPAARQAADLDNRLPPELVLSVMKQVDWWPMSTVEAQHLREELHGDHERARTAIDECVGHHFLIFPPYNPWRARQLAEEHDVVYESP